MAVAGAEGIHRVEVVAAVDGRRADRLRVTDLRRRNNRAHRATHRRNNNSPRQVSNPDGIRSSKTRQDTVRRHSSLHGESR